MKIIGITGRMGSGKTTVGEYLTAHLNIPVFDCDSAAKTAYDNSTIVDILRNRYKYSVVVSGRVDKKALADIIFKDDLEMQFVKSLTDVFVMKEFKKFIDTCESLKLGVCAIESATLLNLVKGKPSELCYQCNFILVKTTENDSVNIERAIKRSSHYISEESVKERLSKQLSDSAMLKFEKTLEIKDSFLPDQITEFVYSLL